VLIASGADYSRLDVEGCARFEGAGVYYAANASEARLCSGCTAIVVGGGNSAGQATAFLAGHAAEVFVLIRGDDLYKSMSSYLVHRLEQTPNVKLMCNTVIKSLEGDGHLEAATVVNTRTGREQKIRTPAVFSFIGAAPRTDWLPAEIERDAKCFVLTGPGLASSPHWTAGRAPYFLETSRSGVFAAGDCRAQSVKRVAAAVGEGSMAVQFVHEYLKSA
jgi:thioredoxin reductase (NADPH)